MKKKSTTLESKLNMTTIKILVASFILTLACLIIGLDHTGLFPPALTIFASYAWMFGALISVLALGLFYRGYAATQVDSD
jgi:hypothetical protein